MASGETFFQLYSWNFGYPFLIILNTSGTVYAKNGGDPHNNTYIITPSDQLSLSQP